MHTTCAPKVAPTRNPQALHSKQGIFELNQQKKTAGCLCGVRLKIYIIYIIFIITMNTMFTMLKSTKSPSGSNS
ncbi:hypothetical protein [Caudoviricetes sp.]|nr:hypothetical protein [Caudoviricetes sp.]